MQTLIEELVLTDIRANAKLVIEDEDSAREMYLAQKMHFIQNKVQKI